MNTKFDPFKYTNVLINNALSAKKAPNPYELFYSLKVSVYNSQKSEVARNTMKLAKGMLEDNHRMVSGIMYAFVARLCNSSRCANMSTRILLLDERNMDPAYTHKIAKTLKGYYKTIYNKEWYKLMQVYEMGALSKVMQQKASLSKQYPKFNYFFYKELSSDAQKINYYG